MQHLFLFESCINKCISTFIHTSAHNTMYSILHKRLMYSDIILEKRELSQILIRNDLMNKLLVSERENNEKLSSYIDYNLEPKIELFKNEMETVKLENRNLKEDLQKITYNLELKLKDFDTIEKENKRCHSVFTRASHGLLLRWVLCMF